MELVTRKVGDLSTQRRDEYTAAQIEAVNARIDYIAIMSDIEMPEVAADNKEEGEDDGE